MRPHTTALPQRSPAAPPSNDFANNSPSESPEQCDFKKITPQASTMAKDNTQMDWATWAFSPSLSAIIVTLVISTLLPILIHFYLYRKASSKVLPTILLLGPSGGGKTSLLTLFSHGTPSTTHTSQLPTTALCQLPPTTRSSADRFRSENDTSTRSQPKFLLLDTPGHGKLRHHATTTLASPKNLKGLVFVLDSAAISSPAELTSAAEYLYDILLLLQRQHTRGRTSKTHSVPVLVAANKQDVFTSLPTGIVKRKLEEELTKVRLARSRGLMDSGVGMEDDAGGEDEEGNWLGEFGSGEFGFAQMEEHGVEVQVVGGNVRGEGGEKGRVDGWWDWVGENL